MVAQLAKGIKPKRLSSAKVREQILNALNAESKAIIAELNKTTATWKGAKPTFKAEVSYAGGDVVILVGPGGSTEGAQKWVWLDEGTKPHPIKAKNKPTLAFRTNFTPKTKVKTFSSGAGGSSPPWAFPKQVRHPGIDAREWSEEIVKRRRKRFTQAIIKAARV